MQTTQRKWKITIAKLRRQLRVLGRDLVVNSLLSSGAVPAQLRTTTLRQLGFAGLHPSVRFAPHVFLGSRRLALAEGVFINYGCFLDAGALITIGPYSVLSYEVMLASATHLPGTGSKRYGDYKAQPISIGSGVWVGTRVTILAGVTIGDGCQIAASAVVTRDCLPDGLYAGVPAKRIKDLDPLTPSRDR